MPPCAASKRPSRAVAAPVNAPFSWPNSSASRIDSGIAAQLTATNGPFARALFSWSARASSSLPVPLSPSSSTVASLGAACMTMSIVRRHASELPMIARRRFSASWALRLRFSTSSDCFSSALRTIFTTCVRLSGFVTKSYAPSFIASTAVSTVPYAVISTTSVSGAIVLAARSRSMPRRARHHQVGEQHADAVLAQQLERRRCRRSPTGRAGPRAGRSS